MRNVRTWVYGLYVESRFRVYTKCCENLPSLHFDISRQCLSVFFFSGEENTTETFFGSHLFQPLDAQVKGMLESLLPICDPRLVDKGIKFERHLISEAENEQAGESGLGTAPAIVYTW